MKDPEDQVVELVKALLLHLRTSEGKEWVDTTNLPKAAYLLQHKRPDGSSLRYGQEEWKRLMAIIRGRRGKVCLPDL